MKISDLIKMGLKNLSRRKARTGLTVSGVIIGTLSIVVMISIGMGMNANFTKQIMEMGSLTAVTIDKMVSNMDENNQWIGNTEQQMDDSVVAAIKNIEHVKAITPVYTANLQIASKGNESGGMLYGMDLMTLKDFDFPQLTYGEYPTQPGSDKIIFGSDMMNLYQYTRTGPPKITQLDPEKDKIFVSLMNYDYQIDWEKPPKKFLAKDIAVMEKTSGYQAYDYSCYMDIKQFKRLYTDFVKSSLKKIDQGKALKALNNYGQIKITVDNVKNVAAVQKEIEALGYKSSSLNDSFSSAIKGSNMMQLVLGCVGAISMLVSAITIANTMIMSIYERTKEIGIMKVLGCLVSDVKKLFLFEAGMIGLIGGVAGIILSYIASFVINKFGGPIFSQLINNGNMFGPSQDGTAVPYSIIPIWLPLLAALFAIAVGVISGYYPARRATRISAIEAMKSES